MPKDSPKKPNPHDEFVKSVFQELPHARGLFRGYLPPSIEAILDWKTLRLERDAFNSDKLESGFADLLFSVQLKNSPIRQRLRLLFEHKRRPDKETPRQLLRYIYRQFDLVPSGTPLPCIITVLLLQHGRCSQATLSSEYRLSESVLQILAPFMLEFRMIAIELSQLNEQDLRGTEAGRFALALLKSVGEGNPSGWQSFRNILRDLCGHSPEDDQRRELRRAFIYVMSVAKPEQEQEVRQSLLSAKAEFEFVEEHVMTLLEHLEQRGEQLGKQRGLRQGRIETLTEWLSDRIPNFGLEDAERVKIMTDDGLLALKTALREQKSWPVIRKLIRSSQYRLSDSTAADIK